MIVYVHIYMKNITVLLYIEKEKKCFANDCLNYPKIYKINKYLDITISSTLLIKILPTSCKTEKFF